MQPKKNNQMGLWSMRRLGKLFMVVTLFFVCFKIQTVTVQAKEITLNVEPADNNGDYSGADIQAALDQAVQDTDNTYYIKVKEGTYTLVNGLHIYSNTTLDLNGVKIKHPGTAIGAMIQVAYPRRETGKSTSKGGGYTIGGYNRGKNIKIIGGTFDAGTGPQEAVSTLVTFSHVSNITIEDVTFIYKPKKVDNAHIIEFGGSKDIKISNCKFIGNQKVGEAIQIESTVKNVSGSDLMGKEDGTKTKNVIITKCKFYNFEYGVGTNHGCNKDIYTGIEIVNNTFEKISKYAISTYNYKDVVIKGNTVKGGSKGKFDSYLLKLGTKDTYKKSKNVVK